MKTKFLITILLISIMTFSCDDENIEPIETKINLENLSVLEKQFYGCDTKKSHSIVQKTSLLSYEFQDRNIIIKRNGIRLNCGVDSVGIELSDSNKNILIVKEFTYMDRLAYCSCNYDYKYTLGEFDDGFYDIYIVSPKQDTFNINIGFTLN